MEIKFLCGGCYTLLPSIRFSARCAGGKTAGPQPSAFGGLLCSQTRGLESCLLSCHRTLMSDFRIIYHIHGENNLGYCNLFRFFIPSFSLCECVHATENTRMSEDSFWGLLLSPHHMGSREELGSSNLAAGYLSLLNHFTCSRCRLLKAEKRSCSNSSLN